MPIHSLQHIWKSLLHGCDLFWSISHTHLDRLGAWTIWYLELVIKAYSTPRYCIEVPIVLVFTAAVSYCCSKSNERYCKHVHNEPNYTHITALLWVSGQLFDWSSWSGSIHFFTVVTTNKLKTLYEPITSIQFNGIDKSAWLISQNQPPLNISDYL